MGIFFSYKPFLPLNVGIPLFLDTPAPVNIQIVFDYNILLVTNYIDSCLGLISSSFPSSMTDNGRIAQNIFSADKFISSWNLSIHSVIFSDLSLRLSFTYWIDAICLSILFISNYEFFFILSKRYSRSCLFVFSAIDLVYFIII